jgi:hypothetical protein
VTASTHLLLRWHCRWTDPHTVRNTCVAPSAQYGVGCVQQRVGYALNPQDLLLYGALHRYKALFKALDSPSEFLHQQCNDILTTV